MRISCRAYHLCQFRLWTFETGLIQNSPWDCGRREEGGGREVGDWGWVGGRV